MGSTQTSDRDDRVDPLTTSPVTGPGGVVSAVGDAVVGAAVVGGATAGGELAGGGVNAGGEYGSTGTLVLARNFLVASACAKTRVDPLARVLLPMPRRIVILAERFAFVVVRHVSFTFLALLVTAIRILPEGVTAENADREARGRTPATPEATGPSALVALDAATPAGTGAPTVGGARSPDNSSEIRITTRTTMGQSPSRHRQRHHYSR